MNIEELVKSIEEKKTIAKATYEALVHHNETTINSWIEKSGVEGVYARHTDERHAEIYVSQTVDGKEHYHSFDLYFESVTWKGTDRKLRINFSCFGSFGIEDVVEMRYCQLLGYLTTNMKQIEDELITNDEATKLFTEYKAASTELNDLYDQKREYERIIREAEEEKKNAEIEAKFVVGATLYVGETYYNDEPIHEVIERITPKFIFTKNQTTGFTSSTKKVKVLELIKANKWSFVA